MNRCRYGIGSFLRCNDSDGIDTVGRGIVAIVVPCKCRGLSFFSHRDDFVIPWQCIRRIGDDIILVDGDLEKFRLLRPKREFF